VFFAISYSFPDKVNILQCSKDATVREHQLNRILYQPLNYFAKRIVERISKHIFLQEVLRGATFGRPYRDINKRIVEKISTHIYFCGSFQPLNYFAKRIVERISTHIYFAGTPHKGADRRTKTT
jgi:hypothetical protein